MQHTCLFTGAVLGPGTKEEHTIPRGLGGRVRSKIVSSSTFTNDCSGIDQFLVLVYAETMATLGPCLSTEHKSGELSVNIPGEEGRFVLDENGTLMLKGVKILASDPATRRPKAAASTDRKKLEKLLEQVAGPDAQSSDSTVPATEADYYVRGRWHIRPEIELSALKSLLLTFDHVLAESDRRFTRSADLAEVRKFVQDTVETGDVEPEDFYRFSLGIQYERLEVVEIIRADSLPRRAPLNTSWLHQEGVPAVAEK
jgi:hypothetical protein